MKSVLLTLLCFAGMAASAPAQVREHKAYCFSLFGSLVSIGGARAIYVPVQTTDPALAAQLTVLQNQQTTMATQLQFDRQAQQLWQQQQAQLQVLQAHNATLMAAINTGKVETQETRDLIRQMIRNQDQLILQLQRPLTVVPVPAVNPVRPAPSAPLAPLTVTPEATTPPSYKRAYLYSTRPAPWGDRR